MENSQSRNQFLVYGIGVVTYNEHNNTDYRFFFTTNDKNDIINVIKSWESNAIKEINNTEKIKMCSVSSYTDIGSIDIQICINTNRSISIVCTFNGISGTVECTLSGSENNISVCTNLLINTVSAMIECPLNSESDLIRSMIDEAIEEFSTIYP